MNPQNPQQPNPMPPVPQQPPAPVPVPLPPQQPPVDPPERAEPYVLPAEPLRPIQQNPAWQQVPYPAPLPTMPTIPQSTPEPTPQLPAPQKPQPSLDFQPSAGRGRSNKLPAIITLIVLIAVLGLSILAYTLLSSDDKKADQTTKEPAASEQARPVAVTFDKVREVSLIPPTNLDSFQANSENTSTHMQYAAIDGSCSLELAVTDPDGKNVDEMTTKYIERLKANGQTVSDPKDGNTLQLKDAASDSVFVLETNIFTAAEGSKQTLIYFSAAPTADGKQVYVIRSCTKDSGFVEPATVDVINKEAANITVIAKR